MLSTIHLDLDFEAQGTFTAPAFAGSMLRGAFGAALKRTVCVMRLRDCDGCPLERACIYTTVFETRPPAEAGVMRLYERAPQPFILEAPETDQTDAPTQRAPGSILAMSVRLFGEAARAAPFVLRAFEDAGQRGFGAARTPHVLIEARDGAGATVWRKAAPSRLSGPVRRPRRRYRTGRAGGWSRRCGSSATANCSPPTR